MATSDSCQTPRGDSSGECQQPSLDGLTPGERLRHFGKEVSSKARTSLTHESKIRSNSRGNMRSLRLSGGSKSAGGGDSTVVKALEERLREREVELDSVQVRLEDLKAMLTARDDQVAQLKSEVHEKDVCIRDAKQQIKALEMRYTESAALSQKYISEARLSRDEEVGRLEAELEAARKAHSGREEMLEMEYRDGLASLENSMDAIKSTNAQLRQENEVLHSTVKKTEARARDAERETQRALNRFEAAIKSLEQLEHQYSVLEEDAKETENLKMQRILALEQEVEDLRVSKSHALHEAQRDAAKLNQKLEECLESLERSEKIHRKAELSAAEMLHREKTMESKLGHVEALYDKVLSENHALQDDLGKAHGEIQRLKGSLDGSSSVSKSMQDMLKTYERDNASLVEELNVMRGRIRVAEDENQKKIESIDMLRKQGARLEEEIKNKTNAALAGKTALEKELEVLHDDVRTKEKLWLAERDSLKREIEVLHAKVEVLSQRSTVKQDVGQHVSGPGQESPEVISLNQGEVEASISDEANSISFGDAMNGEKDAGESASPTPDNFMTPMASRSKQDLRDQLTALKLSILDSTSRQSITRPRVDSGERGYLRSYVPEEEDDDSDTSSLDEEQLDPLSRARHQVTRAKQYLSRLSAIDT